MSTASDRRTYAAMMLAADLDAVEGLLLGLEVPTHRLQADFLQRLGIASNGPVILDDELALRVELLAGQPASSASTAVATAVTEGALESGPRLISPADVTIRDVEWLIRHRLRRNTFNLIQGHGGVNKGTYTCHIAALATKGELSGGDPMMVLFACAEDERETVLQPRLIAAGVDLNYIRYIVDVALPTDIANGRLQERIREVTAGLMFIDPLVTHLDGVDTWKDQQVKKALTPILEVAAQESCTMLGVHHFTKDTRRGALLSGNGSGAFGNTARVVLAMVRDDEDDDLRILEVVKSNGGPMGLATLYRVGLTPVDGLIEDQVTLVDLGDSEKSADQALAAAGTDNVSTGKLQQLVRDALATGSKTREYLDQVAKDELGASPDQLYKRALTPLRESGEIKALKGGLDEGWRWELS